MQLEALPPLVVASGPVQLTTVISPPIFYRMHPEATPKRTPRTEYHSPIKDALSELDSMEKELRTLISVTEPQLKNLTTPSSRDDPFPLKSAISAARLLCDHLQSVTNKATSVRKTKATISDRLNVLIDKLMDGNTSWSKHVKRLPKVREIVPTYETSE